MAVGQFCYVNISGITFCISSRILRRHPYTKLATLFDQNNKVANAGNVLSATGDDYESAIFFDRNPVLFASILDFYRTGQLHVPHSFCYSAIQEELDFWRIDAEHLSECCLVVREDFKKHIKEMKEVQQVFGDHEMRSTPIDKSAIMLTTMQSPFRHKLNRFFNQTDRSNDWLHTFYFIIYLICVVSHLFSYIAQADYRIAIVAPGESANCPDLISLSINRTNVSDRSTYNSTSTDGSKTSKMPQELIDFMQLKYSKYFLSRPSFYLRVIDTVCMILFGLDIALRILAVPKFSDFAIKIGHWVDVACTTANILAFAISLRSVDGITFFNCSLDFLATYLMLEIFRVFRLARLLQFASKYNGILVLLLTVRNSLYELGLLLAALGSGVILFGFLVYIAELGNDASRITSFPVGFWWAVVTMTTLGYGDVYPATPFGYIIGSLCAISGVIFMAVQVPVIGNKFNAFYTYACEQTASSKNAKL